MLAPSEEMLKKVCEVLVSVSSVVVGCESGFSFDVVGETFVFDNSS